eukprot:SAG31_NODE_795_length_12036_cov_28.879953_10_plen_30_part_00
MLEAQDNFEPITVTTGGLCVGAGLEVDVE